MSKNEKDGFVLYKKQYSGISLLSREERGDLLTALYEYQINGNISVVLSDSTAMAFQFIKSQFNIDAQKYLEKCEKSKRAIESRWNKQDTNEYERIRNIPIRIKIRIKIRLRTRIRIRIRIKIKIKVRIYLILLTKS